MNKRAILCSLILSISLVGGIFTGCSLFVDTGARLYDEGNELYRQGRLNEAIDKYTEVINLGGGWEEPYRMRGVTYCDLGQYERGIEDFNEAIRIAPEWGDPYYNRGVAYAELGKKAEAIADFQKFISLEDIDHPEWIEMAEQHIEELQSQ